MGVRESDPAGNTATATIVVNAVTTGISNYEASILATPGLLHYYQLGESSGPTVKDSKGTANGTLSGVTYGVPGAVNGDPNTAVSFPGAGDPDEGEAGSYGTVRLNLSEQSAITVEFWLKWNAFGNNDALAMEFTPNSNENAGGFLIDPNSPEFGGIFGVGIGDGAARNSIYFARPCGGGMAPLRVRARPHAAGANTRSPPTLTASRWPSPRKAKEPARGTSPARPCTCSRAMPTTLFGNGSLDDLAIYGGDLSAARIQEHFQDNGTDPRPTASFTIRRRCRDPGRR